MIWKKVYTENIYWVMVDCLNKNIKFLNLDDAEDGNLINTSDEDKITDEEKAHSITAIWNFEKQNYYLKNLKR